MIPIQYEFARERRLGIVFSELSFTWESYTLHMLGES
jgi:hypothetical protein